MDNKISRIFLIPGKIVEKFHNPGADKWHTYGQTLKFYLAVKDYQVLFLFGQISMQVIQ